MSGKTDALIIPAFLLLLPAAAVVGTARAAGSVLASIRKEYAEAKEAEMAKEQCENQRREGLSKERQAQAANLSRLVGLTSILGEAPDFVADASIAKRPKESAGLPSDRVVPGRVTNQLTDLIRITREEIQQGFPETGAWAVTRKTLLTKLEDIELLAESSPSTALQGVSVLRNRVERELKDLASSLESESSHSESLSSLLADMRAKLKVVTAHAELPDLAERAGILADRLEQLASDRYGASRLSEIEKPIDDLLSELCVRAAGDETGDIVSAHLKDVLLSMGYSVTETPSLSPVEETSMVTPIAPGVGVEFSVDGGRMRTEVVSLSDQIVSAGSDSEELACTLVDRVYSALAERQLSIQEGFRLPLYEGDALRKVTLEIPKNWEDAEEDGSGRKVLRHTGENQ